ncbi:MAG: hypothetical protein ABIH72_04010 [archaeon]
MTSRSYAIASNDLVIDTGGLAVDDTGDVDKFMSETILPIYTLVTGVHPSNLSYKEITPEQEAQIKKARDENRSITLSSLEN